MQLGRSIICGLLCSVSLVAAKAPDILFIAVDDLDDWAGPLGGHPQAKTPNIDSLARQGMLFTNAHAAAPGCNPSRTVLMTGIRPSSSGVYANSNDWRQVELLQGVETIPRYFRNQGYDVRGGGKLFHAHTLFPSGFAGYNDPNGWDEFYPSISRQLAAEVRPSAWPVHGSKEFYFGTFDWSPVAAEDAAMGDAQVVTWAERQLARKSSKPRFLAVGIYRPHIPWYVPQKYFDMHPLESIELPKTLDSDLDDLPDAGKAFARKKWHKYVVDNDQWKAAVQAYLASMSFADEMVGRLLKALRQSGREKNTIVVLWSDHGYHLGVKQHWEKFALWEQATRVPLIIRAPGVTKAGSSSAEPVSLMDLYPTLCDLTRLPTPPHVEGYSLSPLLERPSMQWDHVAVSTHLFNNHAVRDRRYRYIRYADGSEELYDHESDPLEWRNLAADPSLRGVIESLAERLPRTNAPAAPRDPNHSRSGPRPEAVRTQ